MPRLETKPKPKPEAPSWREIRHAPCRVVPEAVVIPSGRYTMGASEGDKFGNAAEQPAHTVRIDYPFLMGRHPVTVGEFRHFRPEHAPDDDVELPVVGVTWWEAAEYCAWLTERTGEPWRLPTEAEWEYACRAGTTTPFPGGWSLGPDEANFLYDESGRRIGVGTRLPVGGFPPNAWGLCCMTGNVCEWVADLWHADYHGAPADGSVWIDDPSEKRRVLRGGAWDYMPRLLRSSWRDAFHQEGRRDNLGFRVVMTIEGEA